MTKKKRMAAILLAALLSVMISGCGDIDAKGFVQASLDAMFQGETESLAEFEKEKSSFELEEEYEDYIETFAAGLTEGLNTTEAMQAQFVTLCQQIFRSVKYNVLEEEKADRGEYRVTVEIRPFDVFLKWQEYLEENAADIAKRAESGEYQGSEEEKLEQVLLDITAESCELLDTALLNGSYGAEEKVVLTVKKNKNKEIALDEEEISDFVEKILCLDTIQG